MQTHRIEEGGEQRSAANEILLQTTNDTILPSGRPRDVATQ
jgi:hypothetical protein